MATTSPDGIYYPTSADLVAPLETVLANNAATIQAALTNRLGPISATGATPGVVPAGTATQRDAFWGVPGTAAARVALAGKAARWHNVDKGWDEQYFAATADASSGRYSRTAAGWYPAVTNGLVPIRPTSFTPSGGSAVLDGGAVVPTGAMNNLIINGVFSADFDDYEVHINLETVATSDSDILFWPTTAGVPTASSQFQSGVEINNSGTQTILSGGGVGGGRIGRVSALAPTGGTVRMTFFRPFINQTSRWVSQSIDANAYHRTASGITSTGIFDGFKIQVGATFAGGRIKVFGINNY